MQLSDLRTMVAAFLSADHDYYDSESPTNNQVNAVVNWALRDLSRHLYLYEPKVALTLANGVQQFELSDTTRLARRMLHVDFVVVNSTTLTDERANPGLYTSLDQFEAKNPGWRTASSGTPVAACLMGQSLTFDKPCSGAFANNFVAGRFVPNDLSGDSDVPLIPTELHELVALFAAVKYAMPTSTEDEQWARLKAFDAKSVALLPELYVRQYQSVHGVMPTVVPGAQAVSQ